MSCESSSRSSARRHNLGMLVVEHDLRLIMRLADRIVVLNEGRRISEGSADDVRNDPAVKEAYLGRRAMADEVAAAGAAPAQQA